VNGLCIEDRPALVPAAAGRGGSHVQV